MSTEKQQWISEEKHNGPPMQDIKHDPRAGSGIEFVTPQEELEGKQIHQTTPENEDSSPKYGVPKPDSAGLETIPGQNEGQENRPVYINNDEGQGSNSGPDREQTEWHYSFWECWKPGSLCMPVTTFPLPGFTITAHSTWKYMLTRNQQASNLSAAHAS
jgi:hypothetical protein